MSRRPKLSLSSDINIDKKQALGFTAAAPSDHAETIPSATESAPGHMGSQSSVTGRDKTVRQASAPSTRVEAASSATESVPDEDAVAQGSASEGGKTAPQAKTTWPVNRQIVKVVFAVVVTALSLYLLRRRLL